MRVRTDNRIEVMKKLTLNFSNCDIIAGEFGEHGDEVAAFVRSDNEGKLNKCIDEMKKNEELREVKKIMMLEDRDMP